MLLDLNQTLINFISMVLERKVEGDIENIIAAATSESVEENHIRALIQKRDEHKEYLDAFMAAQERAKDNKQVINQR